MYAPISPSHSGIKRRDYNMGDDLCRIEYMPSPDAIAKACKSIQSKWTFTERQRRFVGEHVSEEIEAIWRPPVIDTSHFRLAASGMEDTTQ